MSQPAKVTPMFQAPATNTIPPASLFSIGRDAALPAGDPMVARSKRKEGADYPIVLRTYLDVRFGLRAVRAAMSGRHAGTHFDDEAVADAIDRELSAAAPSWVRRTIDLTIGHAVFATTADTLGAEAVLTWRNSERPASAEQEAEIILDTIESHTRGFKAEDREALKKVIADTKQLAALPFLSAAHIAGAWAVLAARQTTIEETIRCQMEAGRWVQEVKL